MSKNILSRIQNKHDIEANWNKATSFIPMQGEIIVYDIDDNYNYERIKIGDGTSTVTELAFLLDTQHILHNSNILSQVLEQYVTDTELTEKGFAKKKDLLNENNTLKNDVLPEGYPYMGVGNILYEIIIPIDPDVGQGVITDEFQLYIGNSYIVNYNGVEYTCEAKSFVLENIELVALGNIAVMDESGETEFTNEPFLLINAPNNIASSLGWYGAIIPLDGSEEIILSIYGDIIKKISKEFLPDITNINNIVDGSELGSVRTITASDIIGVSAHAEGNCTTAFGTGSHAEGLSGNNAFDYITEESTEEEIIAAWNENKFTLAYNDSSHAEGYSTLAFGYASHAEGNYTTASGMGSHAEGATTTANGEYSHAEGFFATASGDNSHAEGYSTLACNDNSHAEGNYTTASGYASHAEGSHTTAFGDNSHAEGLSDNNAFDYITEESTEEEIIAAWNENKFTLASGDNSHAEGHNTLASSISSHAEGYNTAASGPYSHAEGTDTKAYGHSQHVQGMCNLEDNDGKYAHIVGNGITEVRSNAHTLDWKGNAWYQGDVYVGSISGTNKDEGSKKLATEEYVNNVITNPDWTQNDETAADYIKNKPSLAGKNVEGTSQNVDGTNIIAGSNAEIFNNYTNNKATGAYSHAEGSYTKAIGDNSHAEGSGTTANGICAHAEGTGTRASGSSSHAEGTGTIAFGEYSHAEGSSTRATGDNSHAEGTGTIASGDNTHAEGTGTIASRSEQHAQGKYNIQNFSLAHVVGNGTADDARSNAHTLDWNGNAWYAGDVYVGSTSGTDKDEGSKKLATEEYVDSKAAISDWNQIDESAPDYIKNKPFGEVTVGGDTLTWDGNTEGRISFLGSYYKISDVAPTLDDCKNGIIVNFADGSVKNVSFEDLQAMYEVTNCVTHQGFMISPNDGFTLEGMTAAEKGLYVLSHVASITIPGYNGFPSIKTIDPKYLPANVATQEYVDEVISSTADEIKNDLLNSKADTIQKKSGNIIITDNSAYTPVKGLKLYGKTIQNGTPTPDAPAPLESVGADGSLAVTVCGKNLLDISSYPLTPGGYINYQSGERIIDGDPVQKYTEDFIPVEHLQGKTIAMNFNASFAVPGVAFYTEPVKGAYISGSKPGVITVPDNARFMRITVDSVYENLQIEIGSISTEYEPYKSQTLTAQTPNGLPGIPVTSGGNYTDENGQMWVCDEIDFDRGKYVQRIKTLVLNGSENWSLNPSMNAPFITGASGIANCTQNEIRLLCDSYQPIPESASWKAYDTMVSRANATVPTLYFRNVNYTTLDAFKASLADSPIKLQYILAESIETDLTAEEMAQYSALHTNYPNTTIYNDKDAGMELTYYTPTTAVQMVHSPADKGKILSIDQHGCVILKKIETEITWGSW